MTTDPQARASSGKMMGRLSLTTMTLAAAAGLTPMAAGDPLITPGAQLVEVYSAAEFFEGPSWDPYTESLYFSSLTGNGELWRLGATGQVAPWMANTSRINGTFLSRTGRLLCAQGEGRQILSLGISLEGPTDSIVLAGNPAWCGPNDICEAPNGDIYFTAPTYISGLGPRVYHLAAGGTVTEIISDMEMPNGVITSNDGQTLYVSDSNRAWWRSYPIMPDGTVGAGSVFFNPDTSNTSSPDGMSIDEHGNLYFGGRGGLWIVSPQGEQLAMVPVPVFNTNVTFGGLDGRTLYITCDGKIYSLSMEVRGAQWRNVPPENQPPEVEAGEPQTLTTRRGTAQLDGTVDDDGLPDPPGEVVCTWSKVSGPGAVAFGNAAAPDTTASFVEPGQHVLRLRAWDGIRWGGDEVTITVAVPGDLDLDKDVDTTDVFGLITCLTGAESGPPSSACGLADIDEDDDVDLSDFGLLQRCLSGQGVQANPQCAN